MALDVTLADVIREEATARAAEANVGGDRPPETAVQLSMRAWTVEVPEPKFGVFNWEDFPYQLEWYSDEVSNAREVVWRKSTQVGMSAYAWRWGGRRADQFGDTVIYIFPKDVHLRAFVVERIDPAIQESPYLLDRMDHTAIQTQSLKKLGKGWMHFRGSESRAGAQSVAGDALVFDEYDELHQGNLAQMERRLSGARAAGRHPRIRRFGVPTVSGYGIDARFQRSDRRIWIVPCEHCGLEQEVTWEDSVRWTTGATEEVCRPGHDVFDDQEDILEAWRVCKDCEERIDVGRGTWIPQNPGAPVIGYHVSRLIVPKTDLEEIVKNSRKTSIHDIEAFWNNDLGLPYSPSESALTLEDLQAAAAYGGPALASYPGPFPTTMGVDVASSRNLNYRVDRHENGRRYAIAIGEAEDFDEIERLIKVFQPRFVAVDNMPERRMARALQDKFPGVVWLVRYEEDNDKADAIKIDDEKGMITVHRTESIDAMMDGIRQHRNVPLREADWPRNYKEHMLSPKRRTVEDTKGRPRRVYVKTGTRGDDYAHAEVYALVASDLLALKTLVGEEEASRTSPAGAQELGYEELSLTVDYDSRDDPYDGFGFERG